MNLKIYQFENKDVLWYKLKNNLIMRNDKDNVIVNKSFQFALKIVQFCELLEENKKM